MPGGVNVEYVSRYLQSLWFYVEMINLMLTLKNTEGKSKNKDNNIKHSTTRDIKCVHPFKK